MAGDIEVFAAIADSSNDRCAGIAWGKFVAARPPARSKVSGSLVARPRLFLRGQDGRHDLAGRVAVAHVQLCALR